MRRADAQAGTRVNGVVVLDAGDDLLQVNRVGFGGGPNRHEGGAMTKDDAEPLRTYRSAAGAADMRHRRQR